MYDLTGLELAYAPPFSSAEDPVNMAGYVAQNQLEGAGQAVLPRRIAGARHGRHSFVDVHARGEYGRGTILQAINLPLDEIREHLDELDPQKAGVSVLPDRAARVPCRAHPDAARV